VPYRENALTVSMQLLLQKLAEQAATK